MEELIHCIDENMIVLHFTAYPNFSRNFQNEFILTDAEMSSIIFEEDLIKLAEEKSANYVTDILEVETENQDSPPKSRYVSQRVWYTIDRTSCNQEGTLLEETEEEKIESDVKLNKEEITGKETSEKEIIDEGLQDGFEGTFEEGFEDGFEEETTEEESSDEEETTGDFCLTDEEINSFSVWWKNNIRSVILDEEDGQEELLNKHKKVRNMLLAIWGTDKDKFDKEKCSLAQCIVTISEQLRSGKFTFRGKNPNVISAPAVIKDYVGVSNLTFQQTSLFNSSEHLLWINGPAGAGKTVILCGKIIQIVQANDADVVVLFRFCGQSNTYSLYQEGLNNADIKYLEICDVSEDTHTPSNLHFQISEGKSSVRVIILLVTGYVNLAWLIDTLRLLRGYHVFVDDIQILMVYDETPEQYDDLCESLLELSRSKTVRIACDIAQFWFANQGEDIFNLASSLAKHLSASQF